MHAPGLDSDRKPATARVKGYVCPVDGSEPSEQFRRKPTQDGFERTWLVCSTCGREYPVSNLGMPRVDPRRQMPR
jgi:hypothetical protein